MTPTDLKVVIDDERFDVAVARRLGGGLRPVQGRPVNTSTVGSQVIERYDRIVRWLARWLAEGRTSTLPEIEQVLPSENGRLDLTFVQDGRQWWVDVAVTSAPTTCARSQAARAKTDGRAARDEEAVKRNRYRQMAHPFVMEAHGRPGPAAVAFMRGFAGDGATGASQSIADAWAALSSILQSGSAWIEMKSYGRSAVSRGCVETWTP